MDIDLFSLNISGKKQLKEHVTPHRIALLVMIKVFCLTKTGDPNNEAYVIGEAYYKKKYIRNFAISVLKLIQSPDVEPSHFVKIAKSSVPEHIYLAVHRYMKKVYFEGVAGMMNHMHSLESLLIDASPVPIIHRSSVIGLFLRRMLLAFDKLSFSQVTKLFAGYKSYYEQAFADGKPTLTLADKDTSDITIDSMAMGDLSSEPFVEELEISVDDEPIHAGASQKQAELFLAQQASFLQTIQQEALPPPILQNKIKTLLDANLDLAEIHYLTYINCLHVKEYCGAAHALYRAFDSRPIPINETKPSSQSSDDSNKNCRYAALNLTSMHARFGHSVEALRCVKEAITMAQESNDHVCLQHALGWLYRLDPHRRETLMERSIAKSGDLNLPYLTSIGVLALAQSKAKAGSPPAHVFEFLTRSDILNCQHSMLELMATCCSQKAALWGLYGNNAMMSLCSQVLLHLNTAEPSRKNLYYCGEGVCQAVCNIAAMLARQGNYDSASVVLSYAKSQFPPQTQHAHWWMLWEQILMYDRALHHGKWKEAESAVANMAAFNGQESAFRKAHLLLLRGETMAAMEIVVKMLEGSETLMKESAQLLVRLLIVQSDICCVSGTPSSALVPLMKATTVCEKHHLHYLSLVVSLHVANVQLLLGIPSQSNKILNNVMVDILAHGSLYDIARAKFLHVRSRLSGSKDNVSDLARREVARQLAASLDEVIEEFGRVEAYLRQKDALYLQARLYDQLGLRVERNSSALRFRHIDINHSPAPSLVQLV